MKIRPLIALVILAAAPRIAAAQFTTFIPPQAAKTADSVKAVVAAEKKAKADTAASVRLTNMKTWVDSAAGVPPLATKPSAADTLPPSPRAKPSTTAKPRVVPTDTAKRTFRNGARAPATASWLPFIALAGLTAIVVGALLARAPSPARDRA